MIHEVRIVDAPSWAFYKFDLRCNCNWQGRCLTEEEAQLAKSNHLSKHRHEQFQGGPRITDAQLRSESGPANADSVEPVEQGLDTNKEAKPVAKSGLGAKAPTNK